MNSISSDAEDAKNEMTKRQEGQDAHCKFKLFLIRNLEHNLHLLASRFPELYEILHFSHYSPSELLDLVPATYVLAPALKTPDVLTLKVDGKNIHSKYDPVQEAEKISCTLKDMKACSHVDFCFMGLGLGYVIENFIKENKKIVIAVVEPDIFIFILFLATRKLDAFFSHASLILIPASPASETLSILESLNLNTYNSFYFSASLEVSSLWLKEFKTLQERNEKKHALNYNTLKKFYIRWFKNFIKNIDTTVHSDGLSVLKQVASSFPAIIIAAGPSLDAQLPIIKEVQNESIIIAVDTSYKATLNHGIKPDFVVLMDGQYLNYLHIAGKGCKDSILVSESAVYPQVFREQFGAVYLVSSFFPLGRYIEDFIEKKGHLVAGGSVATTAWDFARFIGCRPIIMAGLDLAFTQKKTHASYCHFETEAMMISDRFNTLESANYRLLDVRNTSIQKGYEGDVLTDSKMMMFAWWFESKLEEYPDICTYNLMARGLKIPNMPSISFDEFFKMLNTKREASKKESRVRFSNKHDLIDFLLTKKKKKEVNVQEEKTALSRILHKIYFQAKAMSGIVEEAVKMLEYVMDSSKGLSLDSFLQECEEVLLKCERYNEKLKKAELYKTSGFDVVIRAIEKECKTFENKSNSHLAFDFIEKIAKHYQMLRHILSLILQ